MAAFFIAGAEHHVVVGFVDDHDAILSGVIQDE